MPVFDSLQRASFDGIDFPVRSVSIRGQYRFHTHEYLRVPGGINEKLERGLYMVEMDAVFDANVKGYGDLWPTSLAVMRGKFEQGITSALTIPTIGTIQAFQPEWDQSAEPGKLRSGERVRLSFLEDQSQLFLTEALASVRQSSVGSSLDKFTATRANFELPAADVSIFDAIQNASNAILAIRDQNDLYGGLLVAKVSQLTELFREADRTAESIKSPVNHELLDALHELWDSVVTLGENLAESPRGARVYTVPSVMSVSDISAALYGSPAQAAEIMLNNTLSDPFAVPAGTRIIYFVS